MKTEPIRPHGLCEIIELHLQTAAVATERPESLLERIIDAYLKQLRQHGQIPATLSGELLEDVLTDLREIARETLRKRTYGCLTIADYRRRPSRL